MIIHTTISGNFRNFSLNYIYNVRVRVHEHVCVTVCVKKLEDNLRDLFSFYCVGPRD